MPLTRHVPEARGVLTIQYLEDGWCAAMQRAATVDLDPVPRPTAADALRAVGIDPGAAWATALVREAERRRADGGAC
jgi:hypothetical protein